MTTKRARFAMLGIVILVMVLHGDLVKVSNTPLGLLVFHGTAMLCDWLLLWLVAPLLLQGRVLDVAQWFLVAFMCGNALGWILYMSYAPPSIYNSYMWVLTIAQWASLFIPDRTDENNTSDRTWFDMVRHRHLGGSGNNT